MNRKLVTFLLSLVLLTIFLNSCVPDESCKFCKAVVYDAITNQEISRTDSVEYCGDDLANKENAKPVTINNEKTVWECQ